MCFCDKVAFQNYKDNGQTGYDKFGELSQLDTQKNPFNKDQGSDHESVNTYALDLEFKLCKLVSFLRK